MTTKEWKKIVSDKLEIYDCLTSRLSTVRFNINSMHSYTWELTRIQMETEAADMINMFDRMAAYNNPNYFLEANSSMEYLRELVKKP